MDRGRSNSWRTKCLVIMLSFISISTSSSQSDTIIPGQSINFSQTIVSQGSVFELGIFPLGNAGNYYVAIKYRRIGVLTAVWVANRDNYILSSARDDAKLILTREGDLQLQVSGLLVWNTNTTATDPNTTKAVMFDDGNLIVGSDSSPNLWESFNYPSDTWLPGAEIGLDMTSRKTVPIILTSWKTGDDPNLGTYSFGMDPNGSSELFMWNNKNDTKISRIGASDFSEMSPEYKLNISLNVSRTDRVNYATYLPLNDSTPNRIYLHSNGQLRQYVWDEKSVSWRNIRTRPNVCDSYAPCGSNGICSMNPSPVCSCPEGFQPKNTSDWELGDFSGGCIRNNGTQCLQDKDGFVALRNIRWQQNFVSSGGSAEVCRDACATNCDCSAYSNISGCYLWYGDLLGMEQLNGTSAGETLYLRLYSDELPKKGELNALWIALSITLMILFLASLSYYVYRRKITKGGKDTGQDLLSFDLEMTNKRNRNQVQSNSDLTKGNEDLPLPIFSLPSVFSATDNFSTSNKLGEGGFGPVYKGKLRNGQEVAVKRLSKHSGQGLEELTNEAKLIAKLQHTNLVRLLGCCIRRDEKILIYEYMPNKSLDFFLFDQTKKELLDWNSRMRIIEGIAQGLLYLHHFSRLRIIHRDLKASNILLDADMNPRISDFGMARIFGGNELQENTKHIVGTYGYMPPEYALEGLFSVKTDVFSFGVLLLEILAGERNTSFRHEDCLNLLAYAWKLWTNDTPHELIDPILKTSIDLSMALRYVHVGLLCVQEEPEDRPSISDVVAMIGNEMKVIEVQPKQPAYLARRRALEVNPERFSLNELTYSTMEPR